VREKAPILESALLVIDIQDSFKAGPRWQRRNNPAFERNVQKLVEGWRAAGMPVLFFLHTDDDPGFRRDSPHFKLMDFIRPKPGEPVLIKTTRNCFTSTDLADILRQKGVKRLVITGIQTEQCCETTARVAADLGYDVDFVTEATLTFPVRHPSLNEEMSAEDMTRRTEYALRGRFARIATVDDLLAEAKAALPAGAAG